MWIKWFLIIMMVAMLVTIAFGFLKQRPVWEKLDLMLNLIWYPIGLFSFCAFAAVWFDWDLYKELGANMQYTSDKWVLLISGALFVRSGMHVIESWIPNLKYYSTLETLAMFLMALGVFDLGSVTLNAGSVGKTISNIAATSGVPAPPSPPAAVAPRKQQPSNTTIPKPSFGNTTTVRVSKARVYKDSSGRGNNGYLLKDQKVKVVMAENGYKQIDYNGRLYWIQANHLN